MKKVQQDRTSTLYSLNTLDSDFESVPKSLRAHISFKIETERSSGWLPWSSSLVTTRAIILTAFPFQSTVIDPRDDGPNNRLFSVYSQFEVRCIYGKHTVSNVYKCKFGWLPEQNKFITAGCHVYCCPITTVCYRAHKMDNYPWYYCCPITIVCNHPHKMELLLSHRHNVQTCKENEESQLLLSGIVVPYHHDHSELPCT